MKKTTFSLLIITIITLITATILEKLYGTPWVASNIYGSTWFLLLWALLTIAALIYIIQRRLYQRPLTLLLHLSFVVILIGAAITHYFGINGQIHLRLNETPKSTYIDTNYEERNLPFAVSLNDFQLIYYPGTTNPMDFVSHIEIHETPKNSQLSTFNSQLHDAVVSFNVGNIHHMDLGTLLDRLGIAVRTGHHCAQPLMDRLGVLGTVRASFALYNTKEEIDTLVAGIDRVRKMF